MGSHTISDSEQLSAGLSRKRDYPNAKSPRELKWEDWKQIAFRIKDAITNDHLSIISAGVAFYVMLSIFPLLLAIVSIYGLFADPATVASQVESMAEVMPKDVASIIGTQLHDIVQSSSRALGLSAFISILFAIISAAKGMKALMEGFNVAYKEAETRGMIRLQFHAMLLTLGAALTVIVAISMIAILPAVLSFIGLATYAERLMLIGRWPVLAIVFVMGLAFIHRFAADRKRARWQWVSIGSVVSTLMILIASVGFAYFADNFGNYNETYGSISSAIVFLLWLFFISFALLLGAELNAEVEHQTTADTTVGKEMPMGQRGATVADTLPDQ